MDFFVWVWQMFWRGLTTAPPVVSSNWAGVIFGVIVSALNELNSLRRNSWKPKWAELGWSVLIGACAWIGLAMVNTAYLAYTEHNAQAADINDVVTQNANLAVNVKQLAAKKPTLVQQPMPRDPSLMRAGALLSMVADVRQSVREHGPVIFLISSSDDNHTIKADLDGILAEVCSTKDDVLNSRLVCSVQQPRMAETPISRHQGITMHVNQQPIDSLDKQPFVNVLYQALSKWFTVIKDDDPITPAVAKQVTIINGTATVWIDIGPSSPWKEDDLRLKDGLSQEALKNLMGWRDMPKVRAQRIGAALEQLYKSADEINKTLQSMPGDSPSAGFARRAPQRELAMRNGQAISQYNNTYKNKIVTLLIDLRLNHVDIRDLDSFIFSVKSYTDVGEIGSRLLVIAKDL